MNKCPQCRERLQFVSLGADSKWVCSHCHREFQKGHYQKQILVTTPNPIAMPKSIVKKKRTLPKTMDATGIRKKFAWWEYLAAFVGIPVEVEEKNQKKPPAYVCALSALLVLLISTLAFSKPQMLNEWGLVPVHFLQKGGLTFVTQFFLHVDTWHLMGNVYFLLVFGESVEHEVGHARFLILLFTATLFGNIIHVLLDHVAILPLVGASGGVAGVMLYYAFQFPKKQLGVIFLFQWVRVPAHLYVAFWLIYQVMGAMDQIQHVSPVSYMAHLAGGLVGYALWRVWKQPILVT